MSGPAPPWLLSFPCEQIIVSTPMGAPGVSDPGGRPFQASDPEAGFFMTYW